MLSTMRVLYVEDDEDIRQLMAMKIQRIASECMVAENGQQGLALYRQYKPDIVVSDVQMPEMDGLALALAIKSIDPDTPIIMTTAHSDTDYLLNAIEIGIDGYVIKPIKFDLLRAALEKCAKNLYLKREFERQHIELQRLYDEDRDDQAVAKAIMQQILHNDGLGDPKIQSFIQPAREFSGDIIAAARAPDHSLYVMLADVTGHGLQAALFLLPISRIFYASVQKGVGIADITRKMNHAMREFNVPGRFIATAVARIVDAARSIEVWNGGVPDVFFFTPTAEVHPFESRHFPLGIVGDDAFDTTTEHFHWERPGTLFLASDGLAEAQNGAGHPFGIEGIMAALQSAGGNAIQRVMENLSAHLDGVMPHDDISFMLVNCNVPQTG